MATIEHFPEKEINQKSSFFSPLKTIVETAFYQNNVKEVSSLEAAYEAAKEATSTVVLDMLVAEAEKLGLPQGAKVLLDNNGAVVGRTAKSRHIVGRSRSRDKRIMGVVRQAVYEARHEPFLKASAVVGLDEEFMARAHIMMPKSEINNLYSWLLNFQILNEDYQARLGQSKTYPESDIFIYSNPDWSHPDFPYGLSYFDPKHNVALILGLPYFGEIKKATLTLAWAMAVRHGYVACHGGLKIFQNDQADDFVASFFGLSGSGKSTLTHAKHDNKYDIKVLHDDAFIISKEDGSSIALEPSYFDKTNDYPIGHREQDYFVTVQNCGVTLNKEGKKVLVTEDIRNGNGRTVKSRYATPNRVDKISQDIKAIFWIMKDDSLPPLVKVNNPLMAATVGATLMTKRSNAENMVAEENLLVIEPYANPFRVYPLVQDFENFHQLFKAGVDCYIINTGFYLEKRIPKEVSLGVIETLVEKKAEFKDLGPLTDFQYLPLADYPLEDFNPAYRQLLKSRLQFRLDYLKAFNKANQDHALPRQALRELEDLIAKI